MYGNRVVSVYGVSVDSDISNDSPSSINVDCDFISKTRSGALTSPAGIELEYEIGGFVPSK